MGLSFIEFVCALISVLLLHGVTGQSELGGYIDVDTTLTRLHSPYNVTNTIIIAQNVTLTVDPSVELQFQPGVGVVVGGALVANGTETDRIKFTAVNKESFSIPVGYYQIKLTDGPSPHEGRLEVFANGQWGTVCDDGWDSRDTQVACRQLGYNSGYTSNKYRYGSGHIWLSDVGCSGHEQMLWDCYYPGIGVHSCSSNHAEDIGLVCENSYVETPVDSLWAGIKWLDDYERSTSLHSLLRYTDIEYAGLNPGLNKSDGILQDVTRPALSSVGVPPVLENVNVVNNIQDGVKFSKVPTSATISHSQMSQNGGTGLHTSTVGIGRLRVSETEIVENGGNGIYYGGNAYPEDSNHYKFCVDVSYNINEYISLDHNTNDFVDPTECVQEFHSPPGTTLTAYLLSGSGSSSTGLEFWNGNTTDELLASIKLDETNSELITTTRNAMRVRIYRPSSSYTTYFTLLITVQKDIDYDIELDNMLIAKNSGGVTLQQIRRRLFVINSAITDNHINGINVELTYGQLLLRNTSISHNRGIGFQAPESYGEVEVDSCVFQSNKDNAIYIEFATKQDLHVYVLLINKATFTRNGDIAILVQPHGCGYYKWHFEMVSCYLFNENYGGLKLFGSCSSSQYGRYGDSQISQNTFDKVGTFAMSFYWVQFLTIENNQLASNTGSYVLYIILPSSTEYSLLIQDNTFIANSASYIVYFDGYKANGYGEKILTIEHNQLTSNRATYYVLFITLPSSYQYSLLIEDNSLIENSASYIVYLDGKKSDGYDENIMTIERNQLAGNTGTYVLYIRLPSSSEYSLMIENNTLTENSVSYVVYLDGQYSNSYNDNIMTIEHNQLASNTGTYVLFIRLPLSNQHSLLIQDNTFIENSASNIVYLDAYNTNGNDENRMTIGHNHWASNTGTYVLYIRLPSSNQYSLLLQDNIFIENSVNSIVYFDGYSSNGGNEHNLRMKSNELAYNTGTNVVLVRFSRSAQHLSIQDNIFFENSAEFIVNLDAQSSNGVDEVIFENNVLFNNTCSIALKIKFNPYGYIRETDTLEIRHNSFAYNIPNYFQEQCVPLIPISVISYDKPYISLQSNIIENPLFPLQLIITGDNFGTKSLTDLNWWGTDDEYQIQEMIWDGLDRYEFARAEYFPFLLSDNLTDVISQNASRSFVPFERDGVVGGVMRGNVTLCNTTSSYYVDRDITIPQSYQLHICPGVTLDFYYFSAIFVQGKLLAYGEYDRQIVLKYNDFSSNARISQTSTPIRLVRGANAWTGRLEFLVDGEWYAFCGTNWTLKNALVACRQLGFVDVADTKSYLLQQGSSLISNYQVQCKGNENDLMDCSLPHDASTRCDSSTSVVHVECSRPEWTGVIFPVNNEVSVLHHILIENAGSRYIDSTKGIEVNGAIYIHLHHHELQNIEIISSNIGIKALYTDPHDLIRPIASVSIKDCNSNYFGSLLYSGGFHLHNWDIFDCYGGIYIDPTANTYEDLLRLVDPSDKLSACRADVTLDSEDILILSPPLYTEAMYCDGVFTVTNRNSNGRIGAFILYNPVDIKITFYDDDGLLLTSEGSIPDRNSVVSKTPTMTIRHQSRYPLRDYNFHLLVKGLEGNNNPSHQQPNWLLDMNERTDLDIFNASFSKIRNYGIQLYGPVMGSISNAYFSDSYYGIYSRSHGYVTLKSNKIMTVDNSRFYLIKTRAVDIYEQFNYVSNPNNAFDAHWIFKRCTFENTPIGVYINSISYISQTVIVPRFTIEGCRFFENSQSAIHQYYNSNYNTWNLSILDSEFSNNHGTVLKIDRAGEYCKLSVINNTFDFNAGTVLRIPNELQQCTIKNNAISNNTAPYIVEYFQAVTQSAAMTSGFKHVFDGNILQGNHPKSSSINGGLVCVIMASVVDGVFHYNTFDNEEFCYEFCFGKFRYFDVHKSLDAKLNNWNSGNDSKISDRIFDNDDWNDRPAVSFRPYLNLTVTQRPFTDTFTNCPHKTSLGGRIFQDTSLITAESPYSIQSDITVLENVTLTIEPGVELLFELNVGVLILGRLNARGTEQNRITMKAKDYQWGGIRIVHSRTSNLSESVLQYLDIENAGYLHSLSTPALTIRHASPYIRDVNIIDSRDDGILLDTPSSNFGLKNIIVNDASNGITLSNVGHEDFHLSNVTCKENARSGFVINQEDDGKAFSTCYLKTIPICTPESQEVVVVDKNADMLMHIPPVINYRSSTTSCSVLIQPIDKQILVLQVYRKQYDYSYEYIYIYEGTTSRVLGSLRYSNEYLTVVSPVAGGSLRFYSYYYVVYQETETHIRVISTTDNKALHHIISDSVSADNGNGAITYSTNPFVLQNSYIPHVCYLTFERCQILSNRATSTDYALTLHLDKGSKFLIENCLISHNEYLGGIYVQIEDGSTGDGFLNRILNNEFIVNLDGDGMVNVEIHGSSSDYVQIYGNRILHNSPVDSANVIGVYKVFLDLDTNIVYNNTGGKTLYVNQLYSPAKYQRCSNNLLTYNLGQIINQKYSIETAAKAIEFYWNVIQNPVNDFEIYAPPGSGVSDIINATYNWWGKGDADFINRRLRDSDYVIGSPEIIFEPFLYEPPPHVQTYKCPVGYFVVANNCYGYKGGAVNFDEAHLSCQDDGSTLPTKSSSVLQDLLRNRTQYSNNPSGIWLYYVPGENQNQTYLQHENNNSTSKRQCVIMELSEEDDGVRDISCYAKRPYICTRSAQVKCPNACYGNGVCHGATCVCNPGWEGVDCSKPQCRDVNYCSGFGTCVGPNQCKCRGGWQGRACSTSYCSRFDHCRPCALEDGCGWCDSKKLCLPGTPYTPDIGLCDDWFYYNCFTTGHCSDVIEEFDCAFRQCNKTAPDTSKELCRHCLDVQNCFTTNDKLCQTWDENKCPAGFVLPNYNDTSRISRAEIDEDVTLIDKEDVTLYRCPVSGAGDFADHTFFVTSKRVTLNDCKIVSSEQAGGVLHRITSVTNKDRHTLFMGRQTELSEAIHYADFSQSLEMEPAGDPGVTNDTPNDELIEELLNGDLDVDGSDIFELSEDVTPLQCLGHVYMNNDNPEQHSMSSFIFLPINNITLNYNRGDILISNGNSSNMEIVKEVVEEQDAIYVHTELADCSDNKTYSNGIMVNLSQHVDNNQEIDLSCRGGGGRSNLLILNSNITEVDLLISENNTIVGGPGEKFVGKIVNTVIKTDQFVIIEILTATTPSEIQALPHYSLLTHRRVRRGSFTTIPQFQFLLSYSRQISTGLTCTGTGRFRLNPSLKLTLVKPADLSIENIGVEINEEVETDIGADCEFDNGTYSTHIPLGHKQLGTYKVYIGNIPILFSFHGAVELHIVAKAQATTFVKSSAKTIGNVRGGVLWGDAFGVLFPDPKALYHTEASTNFQFGEPLPEDNLDNALPKASLIVQLRANITAMYPAKLSYPHHDHSTVLPDWLTRIIDKTTNNVCSKPTTIGGVTVTNFLSSKIEVEGTMCDHNCPDPQDSVMQSATAGLDNFEITGTFDFLSWILQENQLVPLRFNGYAETECIFSEYPCCLCEDAIMGALSVPGKLHPDTKQCMCPCNCPGEDGTKSIKTEDGVCECEVCPDSVTLRRTYMEPECPCYCADGRQKKMMSDGSCPCQCNCQDYNTNDTIDAYGKCPCLCQCKDCTNSTIGPTGCKCQDRCPPCHVDEKQVWVDCQCYCKKDNECGILPTCVIGRKGPECDTLDCFPYPDCSGNGKCKSTSGQCSSFCICNDGWRGSYCEDRIPTPIQGDPHLETIDGRSFDFYGIGEFVLCQSRLNDFGVHSRLFYYETASLIGAVAVKAGDTVITITTPGTRSIDPPFLRLNGDLNVVQDKLKYTFGNSTVILDIQQPVGNHSSSAVAVAILSFQFIYGTTFTIEVRHSDVMQRQYLNVMFVPSAHFREKTEGLCGYMDNNKTNDFRGPDGITFADPIDFAESWRIKSSQLHPGLHGSWSWNESNFHVNDTMDNSYTDPTFVPVYTIDDLPEEQKQKAIDICTGLGVEGSLLDACIYDVAVTNDTSFSEQEAFKIGCPSRCSGKGTCVNSTCECLEGWSGEDCRIGECGECVNGVCDAGFCSCDVGWEGSTCNIEATCHQVNNCTYPTQGQCLKTDVCICNEGYTGVDCSLVATCYNVFNCSNNGVCVDFDICNCNYGWRGTTCDTASCETLNFCSANGDCVDLDVCECQDGWKQPSCGTPDCTAVNECSQNGFCIAPDTCDCYNGFIGSNCSQLLNCSLLNNCYENGVCVQDGDDQLTCRCDIGYTGFNCSDVICYEANDCSGQGSCVEPNLCECSLGYAGYECANYSCQMLGFCSGHGECNSYDVCTCTEGFFGQSCEIPTCSDVNDCSNQGLCIDLNVCYCNEGFEGIQCDVKSLPNAAVPVFLQSEYNVTLLESIAIGSVILAVEANDIDVGRNGELSYSFAFETNFFIIGSSTGDISTRLVFDYESEQVPNVFSLIAIAEDNGHPTFSSTATILVFIADVNDNCPELTFGETITDVELPPDTQIGTVIHQIFAEDVDDELNGELVYSFFQVSETITNLFAVSDIGAIYTKATLPTGTYAIRVSVSDQGDPPCSIIIQVNVNSLPVTTSPPPTTTPMTSTTPSATSTSTNSTSSSTMSSMTTNHDIVCGDNNDCGEHETCKAGVCECTCLYVGTTCSLLAQCYDCSMVVVGLYGEAAEFTEDLKNPESEEFKKAVDTLVPFIEVVINDTNTAFEAFVSTAISHFSPGSIVVDYTVTLTEGGIASDELLEDEMNQALILHLFDPNVRVRKDSISVFERHIPQDTLNMMIFTYVGCCIAMLAALLIIMTYLPSRLLKQEASQILLNFCVSLIGQYAVYLSLTIVIEQGENTERLCNALAGLLHYFVLAAAAWAGMESMSVFNRYLEFDGHFMQMIQMFVFAWGIPAIIVGVTSMMTKPNYVDEIMCFLKSDHSIFSALIPLAIVIILVVILYTYVWIKIKKKSALEEGINERQLLVRIKKDAIILLLLILTWVCGYLVILRSTSYVAQPFFWFISTLTGLIMFVFFVIWRPGTKVGVIEDKEEDDDTPCVGQESQILMVQLGIPHPGTSNSTTQSVSESES